MKNFRAPHKRYIVIEVDELAEASPFDPRGRVYLTENGDYSRESNTATIRKAIHEADVPRSVHYRDFVVGGRNPQYAAMTQEENDELERLFEKIAARRAKLKEAWSE